MKLAILLIFLTALVGCVSTSVYVLDQKELMRIKANDMITAKFDGWILSDRAVTRIMDAKIKKINLE